MVENFSISFTKQILTDELEISLGGEGIPRAVELQILRKMFRQRGKWSAHLEEF